MSPIGSGGMGEVFRARDTRLNRDVAIKVLPSHLVGDPLSRARFEREAKAIAALSHRNILAIYDFALDGTTAYVVTELLQGETLRERLREGPLPLRKVIQIGADIALGLAAAHEKGIIHRDVKPENVFVATDGQIKILDFGLARQLEFASAGETVPGHDVTARTDPGTVMGTVGYMSPEQVKGHEADHRSDIFSLGCVLYEAATGRRAFERETTAETMTAILREDPPEAKRDTGPISPALDQVVRHCLEKRPEERFQSARDLGFALQSLTGSATSVAHAVAPPAATRSWRGLVSLASAVALGAVAVAAYYQFVKSRSLAPADAPVFAFTQLTDQAGVETSPSLAPDGRIVVYARTTGADSALWLQRVGTRTAVRLSGPAPASDTEPALSPDGERIAFRSERDGGGIFLMSVSGESVTRLTDFGFSPAWSPNGRHITVAATPFIVSPADVQNFPGPLTVLDVQSGQRREVAKNGMQPAWSPGGFRIAFWTLHKGGQRDLWTVAAGDSGGGAPVPVTDDTALDWSPVWAPDGRALYFSSTRGGTMNLWRVPIDEQTGRVRGEPEPVTTPSTWTGRFSLSRDGTRLAFASLDFRSTLLRAPFDPVKGSITGPSIPMLKATRAIRDHQLSPDGEWVAFTEAGSQEDLFVARVDGGQYRRLTDDGFRDRGPGWSPDGSRIGFYSDRSGVYDLWTIRPDGSGLTALTQKVGAPGFPIWSPDGRRMAFGYAERWHVIETPAAGNPLVAKPITMPTPGSRFAPTSWSSDGQRIVGMTGSALNALTVYSVATQQFTPVPGDVARGYWLFSVWLSDGRRVIVRSPDGISVVDTTTGAGRLLIPVGGYITGCSVGLSRDNRWITYTETATEGDIWIATVHGTGPTR